MSDKDILRRLDGIENKLKVYEEKNDKLALTEVELSTRLEETMAFFTEYSKRKESMLQERLKEEANASKENLKVLEKIKEDLHKISKELAAQPKETALLLVQQKDDIKSFCYNTFSTKTELNDGLSTIRKQAKLLWVVVTISLASLGWLVDKLPHILNNYTIGK